MNMGGRKMKLPPSETLQTNSRYHSGPTNSEKCAVFKASWKIASSSQRIHSSQSPTSTNTIYSTAFSPKSSLPGFDRDPISYLVGCTSCGHIVIWGVGAHVIDGNCKDSIIFEQRGKRRSDSMTTNHATDPIFW